jgi:hypothetical protein
MICTWFRDELCVQKFVFQMPARVMDVFKVPFIFWWEELIPAAILYNSTLEYQNASTKKPPSRWRSFSL